MTDKSPLIRKYLQIPSPDKGKKVNLWAYGKNSYDYETVVPLQSYIIVSIVLLIYAGDICLKALSFEPSRLPIVPSSA